MNKFVSLFLKRTKIFFLPWITTVAILTGSRCSPPIIHSILAIASVLAISTSVYIYNDVTDVEMDRLNPEKRGLPLPSGKVTVREAMGLVYFSGSAGLVLSLLVNLETFLICAAFMTLYFIYSHPSIHLKKRFIFKEGTIATGNLLTCLIGGVAIGSISTSIIFLGLFLFAYAFVGSPIDEASDVEEDRLYGCKTIPMVLRWKRMVQLFMVFLLVMMVTMPLTYQYLGFNVIFPIVFVLSCGLSLYLVFPLQNKPEEMLTRRELIPLVIPWITAQVAVILGILPI